MAVLTDEERNTDIGPLFSHEAVDAFWRVWSEVGEPHKHGVYESTWMAFRAAMAAAQQQGEGE